MANYENWICAVVRKLIYGCSFFVSTTLFACIEAANEHVEIDDAISRSDRVQVLNVSREKIYQKVLDDVYALMRVTPGSREAMIRWELPIRYYVSGLEQYPQRDRKFDELAQQFADLTGLDIQRHEQIYWPQEGTMHHPDSPDNMFTNVHFFFYPDFDLLVSNSAYLEVSKYLGNDKTKQQQRYLDSLKVGDLVGNYSPQKSSPIALLDKSGSNFSMMYGNYYSQARPETQDLDNEQLILLWFKMLVGTVDERISHVNLSSVSKTKYSDKTLSAFDRAFLRVFYSNTSGLKHGINNHQAARKIAKLLATEMTANY